MGLGDKNNNPYDDLFGVLTTHPDSPLAGDLVRPIGQPPSAPVATPDIAGNSPDAGGMYPGVAPEQDQTESAVGRVHPAFFTPQEEGIHNGFLRKLAKTGDVLGSIFAPGAMAMVPGTRLHQQVEENREAQQAESAADLAQKKALTRKTTAEAANEENPEDSNVGKTITTDQGIMQWNPDSKKYDIPAGQAPQKNETIIQGYANAINDAIRRNVDPATDPHVMSWKAAAERDAAEKKSTKEKLQSQLIDAQNKGDTAAAKKLAQQIKDIDPLGEQRTQISINNAAEHKNEFNENRSDKQQAALDKKNAPLKHIIDTTSLAHDAADLHTGPGDYELLMKFVDATKPSSGFRFTESERKMIMHARSLTQDVEGLWNKASQGRLITDEQAQQMLEVMDGAAKQAQKNIDENGNSKPSSGSDSGDIEVSMDQLSGHPKK